MKSIWWLKPRLREQNPPMRTTKKQGFGNLPLHGVAFRAWLRWCLYSLDFVAKGIDGQPLPTEPQLNDVTH